MNRGWSFQFVISWLMLAGCLAGCGSLAHLGKGVPTHRITIGDVPDLYSGRDAIHDLVYRHAWRPDFQRPTHLTTEWRKEPIGGRSRVIINLFERGAGTYQVVMDVEYQHMTADKGWAFTEVPLYVQQAAQELADEISRALGLW